MFWEDKRYIGKRFTTVTEANFINGFWNLTQKLVQERKSETTDWESREVSLTSIDKDLARAYAEAIVSLEVYLESKGFDLFEEVEDAETDGLEN